MKNETFGHPETKMWCHPECQLMDFFFPEIEDMAVGEQRQCGCRFWEGEEQAIALLTGSGFLPVVSQGAQDRDHLCS